MLCLGGEHDVQLVERADPAVDGIVVADERWFECLLARRAPPPRTGEQVASQATNGGTPSEASH